jgi:hypothetical protein
MGLQYGIKEVLNGTVVDFTTKQPILYFDYASASSNDTATERLFLEGGQGNFRLMSFDHTKTSTFKLTLPLVDLKMLALLAGEDLAIEASNVFKREVLTVTTGKVTVSETPLDPNTITVNALQGTRDFGTAYTKAASAPTGQQFSITSKDITFAATENGKQVVVFYQYATQPTAQKISIKANKFPKAVSIFGDGLFQNQELEVSQAVKVNVYKAKPKGNFNLTMSSSAATTLEIEFDVFAILDANGNYSYIDYIIL